MTTPALQRLREARPEAQITLLTHVKLADLWLHHPSVDAVLTFTDEEGVLAVGKKLRRQSFDVGVVLPNSPRSALELFLGRIPHRIGYTRPWRGWLLTQAVPPRKDAVRMRKRSAAEVRALVASAGDPKRTTFPRSAHHVHDYLQLVATMGASLTPLPPRLVVMEDEVAAIRRRFELPETNGKRPRILGLHAGAEYGPAKRWPAERFVEATALLQRKTACHCWVFGGTGEKQLAEKIVSGIQAAGAGPSNSVRSLAGATSLRELCVGLRACDAVLTNDTGPMHLAAALGTPVVVPFGSTSPELTGPGMPGESRHAVVAGDAPCAPCFLRECPIDFRCMTSITVARIVEAALSVLNHRPKT
jgi:lipopolysaccharide heptosyltransferase II